MYHNLLQIIHVYQTVQKYVCFKQWNNLLGPKNTYLFQKMHIEKKHNVDICPKLFVDSWKEELHENKDSTKELIDTFEGGKRNEACD